MDRLPIRIKRRSITVLSKEGISYGGWAHFSKGDTTPSSELKEVIRNKANRRVYFCPYCGEWTIFKRTFEDQNVYRCTGWCRWGNTNDYHVKKQNDLWGSITVSNVRKKAK